MHIGLRNNADVYLQKLSTDFAGRSTGSVQNRAATEWATGILTELGWDVECPVLKCIDWHQDGAALSVGELNYEVFVSPYAVGCDVESELAVVRTVEQLASGRYADKALLLIGDIASEQLMPKKFVFYNPDHHQEIIRLLEAQRPAAVISATTRDPDLAGGVYPFSLIEDGDFMIPSVYMTAEEGERLAMQEGNQIKLRSIAHREPSTAYNVLGHKNQRSAEKITICAHIDAKQGTPGALDNGAGVVVALLLAELLKEYAGKHELELVLFNGEDHYSAAGEMQYWTDYADDFQRIALAANIDAAGYIQGPSAYSTYGCTEHLDNNIRQVMSEYAGIVEGEPWVQSDHSLFIQRGRPALAITSSEFQYLTTHITHTTKDCPELVDTGKLVEVALALHDIVVPL